MYNPNGSMARTERHYQYIKSLLLVKRSYGDKSKYRENSENYFNFMITYSIIKNVNLNI